MDQTIKEGYRIFLVEDDTSIVEVLSRQLTRWNFSVYPIQDFQDVLGEFCACSPPSHCRKNKKKQLKNSPEQKRIIHYGVIR